MQKKIVDQRRTFILLSYWLAIMALLLLLVAATYTWFSLSKTPRVNDMDLYVSSPSGLEIAQKFDAPDEDWGQSISFAEIVSETSPLKPCTWSDRDGRFYAPEYGLDGRMTSSWRPLSDSENANMDGEQGYYTMGTVYARSKTAVTVSLSEAVPMEDGTEGAGTYLIGHAGLEQRYRPTRQRRLRCGVCRAHRPACDPPGWGRKHGGRLCVLYL